MIGKILFEYMIQAAKYLVKKNYIEFSGQFFKECLKSNLTKGKISKQIT